MQIRFPMGVPTANVAALTPYSRNARTHSDEQVAQIAASMVEFGFTNPLLIDGEGNVVAGHGRLLAAKTLGLTEVPVVRLTELTAEQRRAYVLADNKLALNAGWDPSLLREELLGLEHLNFDLSLTGFGEAEIAEIMAWSPDGGAGETDPDAESERPADPVSALGDLWILGRHRLLCGDSTDADAVAKALGDAKPHLMVTDPPYGVEYDADWRNHTGDLGRSARAVGKVLNDDRADWREAWALFARRRCLCVARGDARAPSRG